MESSTKEIKDFERCSPTACGCITKEDCPNQQPLSMPDIQYLSPAALKRENKELKEYIQGLQNECEYLNNQSIAIDKIIFNEDLSVFEKVQQIQKLLI